MPPGSGRNQLILQGMGTDVFEIVGTPTALAERAFQAGFRVRSGPNCGGGPDTGILLIKMIPGYHGEVWGEKFEGFADAAMRQREAEARRAGRAVLRGSLGVVQGVGVGRYFGLEKGQTEGKIRCLRQYYGQREGGGLRLDVEAQLKVGGRDKFLGELNEIARGNNARLFAGLVRDLEFDAKVREEVMAGAAARAVWTGGGGSGGGDNEELKTVMAAETESHEGYRRAYQFVVDPEQMSRDEVEL
jgi:hypothetical protein